VAVAAGLFAGSFSYSLAHPAPHQLTVATVNEDAATASFIDQLDRQLGSGLALKSYPTPQAAAQAVDEQQVFAVIGSDASRTRGVRLEVVPAAGATVSRLLLTAAPGAAKAAHVMLAITQSHPLQSGDPDGLGVFYITLAAVVLGFLGTAQLAANAPKLSLGERFVAVGCTAALGAFTIAATVDWILGVLSLPFAESWAILILTMATCGLVFIAFQALLGRWAIVPTWLLLVMLGNPSSGGAVSAPLLPEPMRTLGRWLPPGASVNAQHTAIYFHGDQDSAPFVTLAVWGGSAVVIAWIFRRRRFPARPRS
jgi:hypothetical protein